MAVIVYMTASSTLEAQSIGAALVEKRLAACVNILGPIDSMFRWDGAVQSETEIAFIAKTTEQHLDDLIHQVTQLHSYDTPCIVALPITSGSTAFLEWIKKETGKEQ